jgi:predicted DNA-binding ribbon-helix-helix protein
MYVLRMHRTQLYLDRAIHARLKAVAKRRGRTVSDLVREALELVYGSADSGERFATLRGIAGLWRNRDDLADTDAYVRRLRRDTRQGRRPRN